MEMGTKYDSVRSCPPYVSAIMQRYRITYDQSRPNSREGGGYPNGSEGIRKTWWRSEIDRELERFTNAEFRGLKKTKKGREREKRRRRKGKIEEGRSRRSQLSATFLPFDRSSLSRRFFHRRIYFRWYQSREKIPAGISSPAPPPSMKSASVGPQRFPLFLLDRLAPRSRYIFSKTSSLITPLFLPFFLFFEAFSSKRGGRCVGTFLRIVLLSSFLSLSLVISPSRVTSTRLYSGGAR